MRIRPMRPDDVEPAERLTAQAFTQTEDGQWHERSAEARRRWTDRTRHLIQVDPGGCWVADNGDVVGIAVSARRDLSWVLSSYAVHPDTQGHGVGKALLETAVAYGDGCLRGMLCAMPNAPALRRYRSAGFTLHPTMCLKGTVDRSALPIVDGVRTATEADLDLVDSVDRQLRGATHRPDHAVLMSYGPLLVCDLLTGSGYAFLDRSAINLLAATNRAVAQRLLWAALARTEPHAEVTVRYLTSEQEWALDVGLAAGLRIERDGYLALRNMRPPVPYVPSVSFG